MIKPATQYYALEFSPQAQKIIRQIEALESELAKLVSEYDYLVTTVIPELETKYQLKIGKKEYQFYELTFQVNRLKRKLTLLQTAINRGEKADLPTIEKILDIEFKQWGNKLKQLQKKLLAAKRHQECDKLSNEETKELQKLYRELVKKLHPDINPDLNETLKNLWQRVLEAYHNGDLLEMEILSRLLDNNLEIPRSNKIGLLHKQQNELKAKVEKLLNKIEKLRSEYPLNLAEKLNNPGWIEKKRQEFSQKIALLQEKKVQLTKFIATMEKKDES